MRRVLLICAARSGGSSEVQGRVAALGVVEDLDEVEHRRAQPVAGGPGVAVQQLALQGGEEALGHGIVQRIADTADERR